MATTSPTLRRRVENLSIRPPTVQCLASIARLMALTEGASRKCFRKKARSVSPPSSALTRKFMQKCDHEAHAHPRRKGGMIAPRLAQVGRSRDVDVSPRSLFHEIVQKY